VTATDVELSQRRVFVVEDEALVSMLLQDMLADVGCVVVGAASRVKDALDRATSLPFDVAILDVNLNGEQTFAVADALDSRGIRFLFSTGYAAAALPDRFQAAPVLRKPFAIHDLEQALRAALA
jgi:CheY-like chemotaxis protein